MKDSFSLSDSWDLVSIQEAADINPKSFCPLPSASKLPVHFVSMSAVAEEFGGINISITRPLGEVQKGYTAFGAGDVLFAKITPCMENGKLAVVPELPEHVGYGSTEFHVLKANAATTAMWLAHFLSQSEFRRFARQHMTGTAGQLRVSTSWLAAAKIPIAPVNEQIRIVAKLEELLSDLDAGVAELKAAQKKLTQYRQSLLKAAVEGALTKEWRERRKAGLSLSDKSKNPSTSSGRTEKKKEAVSTYSVRPEPVEGLLSVRDGSAVYEVEEETGAELLARILKERRARWEARQLAKFKEQGKAPPKDWQEKYPEPVKPDTTNLPELPERWVWASAEQICDFVTKGTTPSKDLAGNDERTVPFLRVTNLTDDGRLNFSDQVFVSRDVHLGFLGRSIVYPNDVLMNIVGPPLGQVSIVPAQYPEWNVNQAIAIFRAVDGLLPEFLCSFLLSANAQKWLQKRAKTTAGQTNLTLEVCRALPVPLPPTNEQALIVSLAKQLMDSVADQDLSVVSALKQSTAQRKNILKAAFSGQLVPQDPNDEPASVLLERIRAERDLGTTKNSPRKGIKERKR